MYWWSLGHIFQTLILEAPGNKQAVTTTTVGRWGRKSPSICFTQLKIGVHDWGGGGDSFPNSYSPILLGRTQVTLAPGLSASVSCLNWSVLGWRDTALKLSSDQPENSSGIWLSQQHYQQVGRGKKGSNCFSGLHTQAWCQCRLISARTGCGREERLHHSQDYTTYTYPRAPDKLER